MTLKDRVIEQGTRLLHDARLLRLVQSEQFMKAVVAAMSLPNKVEGLTRETGERLVKYLHLAHADEVRDLRRTVRALEDEIAELRRERGGSAP